MKHILIAALLAVLALPGCEKQEEDLTYAVRLRMDSRDPEDPSYADRGIEWSQRHWDTLTGRVFLEDEAVPVQYLPLTTTLEIVGYPNPPCSIYEWTIPEGATLIPLDCDCTDRISFSVGLGTHTMSVRGLNSDGRICTSLTT